MRMINLPTLKDKTDLLLALIDDLESKISYKQIGKVEHFSEMRKLIKSFDDVVLAHAAAYQKEIDDFQEKIKDCVMCRVFQKRKEAARDAVLALAPQIKLKEKEERNE